MNVHFSSQRLDWQTPQAVYDELDKEFNFNLDPCCTKESAKCSRYFTEKEDGLSTLWCHTGVEPVNVFMNPPYGREIVKWMEKAYQEIQCKHGPETIVCLVPSRTDTRWWHNYCMKADEIRFIKGRLKFDGHKNSAPFPSALVIFRKSGDTK